MNGLAFLIDAPGPDDLTALDAAKDTATSEVQIAKVGRFKDPRYGKFRITLSDFAKWVANFAALSKAGGRAGLPVDVDHGPERTGNTEAAGWITKLSVKGMELWATVEWNTLGRQLVGDRRYLYLSPTYHHDFADEEGTKHGTALVGVALTNRPFLSMATVSLSREEPGFAVEEEPEPDASDSRERMGLLADLIKTLSLADDATEADVTAKIAELQAEPDDDKPEAKSLDQLAGEAGKVVLDASTFTTLKANAESGAAAAKELHDSKFESGFATALSEGRVTPAQKENFTALYAADAEATLTMLAALPVAIHLAASGGSGGGTGNGDSAVSAKDAEGNPVDEDRAAMHAKAVTLAAEKNIDYGEAILLVAQEG